METPGLAHPLPAFWIPQLEEIHRDFERQGELLMTILEQFNALKQIVADGFTSIGNTIETERAELVTAFDALQTQVAAGQDATAELAAVGEGIATFGSTVNDAVASVNASVASLSDDATA
jgi:hypothetical protein